MAVSDELKEQIAEAVRIVREDRFEAYVRGKLAPTDPPPNPDADGNGKPPPPKPDDPPADDKPAKGGLWWKEVGSDDVEPASGGK